MLRTVRNPLLSTESFGLLAGRRIVSSKFSSVWKELPLKIGTCLSGSSGSVPPPKALHRSPSESLSLGITMSSLDVYPVRTLSIVLGFS